jgi:hypothetical protein
MFVLFNEFFHLKGFTPELELFFLSDFNGCFLLKNLFMFSFLLLFLFLKLLFLEFLQYFFVFLF